MVTSSEIIKWSIDHPALNYPSHKDAENGIKWVLDNWPSLHFATGRKLTPTVQREITRQINAIPTGKQRYYRNALNTVVAYLHQHLGWQIPEKARTEHRDRENALQAELQRLSYEASRFYSQHEGRLGNELDSGQSLTPGMAAVELLFTLAPLPLSVLLPLLKGQGKVEKYRVTTVSFDISTDPEQVHFVRYLLLPRTEQVLQRIDCPSLTEYQLVTSLEQYLGDTPFYRMPDSCQFAIIRKLALSYWASTVSPFLMRDLMYPESQFALPPTRFASTQQPPERSRTYHQSIYANPVLEHDQIVKTPNRTGKNRWEHRHLIAADVKDSVDDTQRYNPAYWPDDNVLGPMLWCFTAELLRFGGVKKARLALSTVRVYTHIEQHLPPLSKSQCLDDTALNSWVENVVENAPSPATRKHLVRFIRYAAQLPLTDAIDTDNLNASTEPVNVDADLVTPGELDAILARLDSEKPLCFSQWLFSRIAASLAFHGALRRGEILRLRVKDVVHYAHHQYVFRLTICATPEGQTKNRKRRTLYVALPSMEAQLLSWLLSLKRNSVWRTQPLLALANESLSQRALRYILPVTRAIKSVCGENTRFHHLRHGGALVLMRQGISLERQYYLPFSLCDGIYEATVYSQKFIKARFDYWLRAHDKGLNTDLTLDEVLEMIGHSDYSTTRHHYLHGHDWLMMHYLPPTLNLTKTAVRHGLGMAPRHGDLSRQLSRLGADERGKSVTIPCENWIRATIKFRHNKQLPLAHSAASLDKALERFYSTPEPLFAPTKLWQHALNTMLAPEDGRLSSLSMKITFPYIDAQVLSGGARLPAGLRNRLIPWLCDYPEPKTLRPLAHTSREANQFNAFTRHPLFAFLKGQLILLTGKSKRVKVDSIHKRFGQSPIERSAKSGEAPGLYLRFNLPKKQYCEIRSFLNYLTRGTNEE